MSLRSYAFEIFETVRSCCLLFRKADLISENYFSFLIIYFKLAENMLKLRGNGVTLLRVCFLKRFIVKLEPR